MTGTSGYLTHPSNKMSCIKKVMKTSSKVTNQKGNKNKSDLLKKSRTVDPCKNLNSQLIFCWVSTPRRTIWLNYMNALIILSRMDSIVWHSLMNSERKMSKCLTTLYKSAQNSHHLCKACKRRCLSNTTCSNSWTDLKTKYHA